MLNVEVEEVSAYFPYTEVLILSSDIMPINFPEIFLSLPLEVKFKGLDHASAGNTYMILHYLCGIFCGQYGIFLEIARGPCGNGRYHSGYYGGKVSLSEAAAGDETAHLEAYQLTLNTTDN